jgi:type I restriction-modification system DNA methylase subunit
MEASAYKRYIFGMLFLKYASDQLEAEQQHIISDQRSHGRSQAEAEQRAVPPFFHKPSTCRSASAGTRSAIICMRRSGVA